MNFLMLISIKISRNEVFFSGSDKPIMLDMLQLLALLLFEQGKCMLSCV